MKKFLTKREWSAVGILAIVHWIVSAISYSLYSITLSAGGPNELPNAWQQMLEHIGFSARHIDYILDSVLEIDSAILYYPATAIHFFLTALVAYILARFIVQLATKQK